MPFDVHKMPAFDVRNAVAFLAMIVPVTVYITCIAITLSNDTYIGGLSFPYFSDTGRDPPAYYVFAVGLSISAILFCIVIVMQYGYVLEIMSRANIQNEHVRKMNIAATFFGIPGSICAALVGCFSTSDYASIHDYSAYVFFVFSTVFLALETTIYKLLAKEGATELAVTANLKLGIMIIYAISFIIYLPVGLAIVCDFERLALTDCLDLDLGAEYCQDKYLSNTTATADVPSIAETSLWDYTPCSGTNELRSVTQCICMFMLMAFYGSFAADPVSKSVKSIKGSEGTGAPDTGHNSLVK